MVLCCKSSLENNFMELIENLDLDNFHKKIIQERYLREVIFYSRKGKLIEFFYLFLSIFVTVATTILPALLSIQEIDYSDNEQEDKNFKKKIYWTTWVVSLLITISNGLVQFFNLQQQFVSYNQTKEKLLSQGWYYLESSGSYKGKNHRDNFISFCENIEKIKKSQVSQELMFISDNQEKKEEKNKIEKQEIDSLGSVSLELENNPKNQVSQV